MVPINLFMDTFTTATRPVKPRMSRPALSSSTSRRRTRQARIQAAQRLDGARKALGWTDGNMKLGVTRADSGAMRYVVSRRLFVQAEQRRWPKTFVCDDLAPRTKPAGVHGGVQRAPHKK
jgi:hypothetical protein